MGRNKEPIDLALAKGTNHLTKDQIEERRNNEVKAKSDCILIPDFVPPFLQERFLFISQQLQDIGIMSNLDVDCLGRYVVYQYQWERAYDALSQMPIIRRSGNNTQAVPNEDYDKLLNTTNKLQKAVKAEASGLGLTISDRCKLVIPKVEPKQEKETDPFDELFGGDE